MGIKLEDIEVKTEIKGDLVFYKARLRLTTETNVPVRMLDLKYKEEQRDFIFHQLRNKLLEHIYGDLIAPINELANIARHNPSVDEKEMQELRKQIGTILAGKEIKSVIIQ